MKILVTENQFNLIRKFDKLINETYFDNIIENILLENKRDVLINKLGLSEEIANRLYELAGNLSIIFANKIIDLYSDSASQYFERYNNDPKLDVQFKTNPKYRKQFIVSYLNNVNGYITLQYINGNIPSIMDWIRVGLNGNFKPYENLPINELSAKSKEWHDSLQIGTGNINYIEKKDIILDFRNNGEGFYWADLGVTKCPEEKDRMGHCASSKGRLYSLREYKKIDKYTTNKSHLTASVDNEGNLLQLKGPKNSKPKEEFHKYITPFLMIKKGEDYLVKKFGSEYDSSSDFKIIDLNRDEVIKLYKERPDLFNGYPQKLYLDEIGIRKLTHEDGIFYVTFSFNSFMHYSIVTKEINDYLYNIFSHYTKKQYPLTEKDFLNALRLLGHDVKKHIGNMLDKELQYFHKNVDFPSLEDKVSEIIKLNNSGQNVDVEILELVDDCIQINLFKTERKHVIDLIVEKLRVFGEIISVKEDKVVIRTHTNNILRKVDKKTFDEALRKENGELSNTFWNLIWRNTLPQPELNNIDLNYRPNINRNEFNDCVSEKLNLL
jgi:hypothetical protein